MIHRDEIDRIIRVYSHTPGRSLLEPEFQSVLNRTVNDLVRHLQLRPRARILDLACGGGDIAIALALRGFDVVGVDCTPAQIERAHASANLFNVAVDFRCMDMRQIDFHSKFDAVMLRDVIFSVFDDPRDDQEMIGRMVGALKPGGRCLFEVYNKEFAIQHGVERILFYDVRSKMFVPKDGDSEKLSVRLYDREEWRRMLNQNGLVIEKIEGWSWKGDPESPPRADVIVANMMCELPK